MRAGGWGGNDENSGGGVVESHVADGDAGIFEGDGAGARCRDVLGGNDSGESKGLAGCERGGGGFESGGGRDLGDVQLECWGHDGSVVGVAGVVDGGGVDRRGEAGSKDEFELTIGGNRCGGKDVIVLIGDGGGAGEGDGIGDIGFQRGGEADRFAERVRGFDGWSGDGGGGLGDGFIERDGRGDGERVVGELQGVIAGGRNDQIFKCGNAVADGGGAESSSGVGSGGDGESDFGMVAGDKVFELVFDFDDDGWGERFADRRGSRGLIDENEMGGGGVGGDREGFGFDGGKGCGGGGERVIAGFGEREVGESGDAIHGGNGESAGESGVGVKERNGDVGGVGKVDLTFGVIEIDGDRIKRVAGFSIGGLLDEDEMSCGGGEDGFGEWRRRAGCIRRVAAVNRGDILGAVRKRGGGEGGGAVGLERAVADYIAVVFENDGAARRIRAESCRGNCRRESHRRASFDRWGGTHERGAGTREGGNGRFGDCELIAGVSLRGANVNERGHCGKGGMSGRCPGQLRKRVVR